MYAGVPTIEPARVTSIDDESAAPGSGARSALSRARPKSATRGRSSSPTSTLSGLKSRCTMPAACAAARPSPAAQYIAMISRADFARSRDHARAVPPATSSIATNTRPSTSPTSYTTTTLGCDSRASACASRSMRASAAGEIAEPTLRATSRASRVSRAR